MVQDSPALLDLEYVKNFRVSKIISFSDMDINFQRQLGIHNQVKGFLPIVTREENTFDPARHRHLGYVGRIDFHAKGCDRLIPVARMLKQKGLPPIKLFTTTGKNSPHYGLLLEMIAEEGLSEQFDITLECTDKEIIYSEIAMLMLPSRKESFGNVILEAYSYGIPVISTAYAPGPSELIDNDGTGYLLDDFSGLEVVEIFQRARAEGLSRLSSAAFEKHKLYSMERHLDFLEQVATDVFHEFDGTNRHPVFPELKMVHTVESRKKKVGVASSLAKSKVTGKDHGSAPVGKPTQKKHIKSRRDYAEGLDIVADLAAKIRVLEAK